MKSVTKFTTFEELKSCKNRTKDVALSLKRHDEFEKVIKDIRSINIHKNKEEVMCIENANSGDISLK